jgi:hypothetical protein
VRSAPPRLRTLRANQDMMRSNPTWFPGRLPAVLNQPALKIAQHGDSDWTVLNPGERLACDLFICSDLCDLGRFGLGSGKASF